MVDLDNRPELPDIFPQTDITVEAEEHTFTVSETTTGTTAQYEYTLDKAPVKVVQSIQGVDQDGNSRTFNNGTDYTVSDKTERVFTDFTYSATDTEYILKYQIDSNTETVTDSGGTTYTRGDDYEIRSDTNHYGDMFEWLDDGNNPQEEETFTISYDVTFSNSLIEWQQSGNNLPRENSVFYVTYTADSVISRYLSANEERLDQVNDALTKVIDEKFVDSASGESLDRIGRLFGQLIGKRRGRTDEQYRIYLKSVVQSFISRGTVTGIKLAISAATDVPIEDITIDEDFSANGYEVRVVPNTPVVGSLIEEVAEIADPSGVEQLATTFALDPEEVELNDNVKTTTGTRLDESISSDDLLSIDPNKLTVSEQLSSDDTIALNPNVTTVSEDTSVTDSTQVSVTFTEDLFWEPTSRSGKNWNEAKWMEIEDIIATQTDEDISIDDGVSSTESTVAWDSANWDSFDWAANA